MLIHLSKNMTALIDDDMAESVLQHKWFASGRHPHVYAKANMPMIGGKRDGGILMHRLVMGAPSRLVIDHINGNTLDNRRCNLRVCEHRLNIAASRSRTGVSKFKGVTFDKSRGKWAAQIKINYKRQFLGRFESEEAAARSYDTAAIEAWCEFAVTNFPKLEAENYQ